MKAKVAKVVTFVRRGHRFELNPMALREIFAGRFPYPWREASRNSIKRVFTIKSKASVRPIWGKYAGHAKYEKSWNAVIFKGCLHIGCIAFTPAQTKLIKKWALAYGK